MYSESSPEVLELHALIVELESLLIALMSENSVLKAENERLLGKVPGGGGSGVSGSPKASNPLGIKSSVPQTEGDAPRKRKKREKGFSRAKASLSPTTEVVIHSLDNCPDCGHRLAADWVHWFREVLDIPPVSLQVTRWYDQIYNLYREACEYRKIQLSTVTSDHKIRKTSAKARDKMRLEFQHKLRRLAEPYHKTQLPQAKLAARLLRFEHEMFTFVEFPEVPPDNNAAERAIRPAVIARKISGGTRSKLGSETYCVLTSLFATWSAKQLNPVQQCKNMLAKKITTNNYSHQL